MVDHALLPCTDAHWGEVYSMPLRVDRLIAVMAIGTLFMPAFRIRTDTIDLYLQYALLPLILALCVAAGTNLISRRLGLLLAAFAGHSLLSVLLLGNPAGAAAQQLVGIAAFTLLFYNVACVNRFDPTPLFAIYTWLSKLIAAIAIVQFAFFLAGFRPGYDLAWTGLDFYQSYTASGLPRIQSVFGEPSHFALAISPAVYLSVLTLLGSGNRFCGRLWSIVILTATVLSFSAMAYLAIVFALCLAGLRHGPWRKAIVMAAAGSVVIAAYAFVPEIRLRVDDTFLVFLHQDPLQKNISTLTLYNNWQVALGNLFDSYLLGGGLGSHPIAFERYSTLSSLGGLPYWLASLNAQDANSLLLRILSELGLPGVAVLSVFLLSHFVPGQRKGGHKGSPHDDAWLVSNAALTFIAMALVRHGHYFVMGTPFFLLLYYYAHRHARLSQSAHRDFAPQDPDEAELAEPA